MNLKIRILILDDRQSDADMILYELKKSGIGFSFEVVQTRDAYEKALDTFLPDIVLSDYSMPAFDGITAFNIKQKKYPEIPFIILSSAVGEENAVEMIKNGVTDYVLKDKLFTLNTKVARALSEANEKNNRKQSEMQIRTEYDQELALISTQLNQVIDSLSKLSYLMSQLNLNDPKNQGVASDIRNLTEEFNQLIEVISRKNDEITVRAR